MRLEAYLFVFIVDPFNIIIVVAGRHELTITQLSGDGSESSTLMVFPIFLVHGYIYFDLSWYLLVNNLHFPKFSIHGIG